MEKLAEVKTFGIERDGLLPGSLPAYRVLTVTVKGKETKVERSKQQYILAEALAIVEDEVKFGVGL